MKPKKERTTVQERNRLRVIKAGMLAGAYACPLVPASVMVGINWDTWVKQTGSGWTLGFGFGALIISLITTYIAIAKGKNLFEKISAFFGVGVVVLLIAVSLKTLAYVIGQFGEMFFWIGIACLASGADEVVEKLVLEPKLKKTQELVDKYVLEKKAFKENKRFEAMEAKAQKEAEAMKNGKVF